MRRCRFIFSLGLILGLYCAGTSSMRGQEFRASITGLVTDPSGAPIAGAAVKAVRVDAAQVYTAKTDTAGLYTLMYLLPGKYTVSVEAQGFQTTLYNNVALESAQRLNLNATLALGSVSQQLTVSASQGLLTTETASVGGVVDNARVEDTPRAGEVWMNFVFTPGVVMTSGNFSTGPRNNSDRYSVNGGPVDSNSFYLNGAPVSDQGAWYFVPNQDAVEEVQGGTSYDAQYGRAAGGAFNSNVKAGTNRFHGTLYDYYGNKVFNSNLYQSNLTGIPKSTFTVTTFGASAGGPIRKDKTFFFESYEGFREDYPKTSSASVPPANWITGDFSQSGYAIYDPLTATCASTNTQGQCSQYKRAQFPNNIIPTNRINAIGQAILKYYPAPQFAGSANNYYPNPGGRNFLYDQNIARIDQYFSDSTRFYGLFTVQRNWASQPVNGLPGLATNGTISSGMDYNGIAALTKILSPSMSADVRLSFGRYTSAVLAGQALGQNFTGDKIGGLQMPFVPTTLQQNIVPAITVTGFTTLFGNTNNGSVSNDWDLTANLAQIKGRHNIRYGFEFGDVQSAASGIPGEPNGTFGFGPGWTQGNPLTAAVGQGSGIASLLLGYPASGSVDWNSNLFISYHYYGAFVQDDFKLSKTVTLNLGLRWDVNKSPSERYNRINAGFCFTCQNPYSSQINYAQYPGLPNPLTGGLLFAGVGTPSAPFDVQWHNWQPRFGVSWAVTPKWVLRAGYGLYYSWGRISSNSAGFNQSTPYISSLDGNITPANYFLQGRPFPDGALALSGSSQGLATQAGQAVTYTSPDRRIPSTQHWSIGFQRELARQMALDVEYVGSHSHALAVSSPWDTVSLTEQAACFQNNALCNTNVPNPFYGILPKAATLGASTTVQAWQLTTPWPLFNSIAQSDLPAGESDYNALQVSLDRKVASLDFAVNYTYSNWMEEMNYLNNGNFRDAKLWRGLDPNDNRHAVTIAALWAVPVGKGGRLASNASGVLGALISHWRLQSNIRWASGTPLAIPSADFYGPGCTSYAPPGGQTHDHWINNDLNCYHPLLPWEARTPPLYVGYLRNPALVEWSPSMEKAFALPWEGTFVQFRVEALNGANHPIFAGPNETVATKPAFTPGIGWVGFGTLPQTQQNTERRVLLSLRIIF